MSDKAEDKNDPVDYRSTRQVVNSPFSFLAKRIKFAQNYYQLNFIRALRLCSVCSRPLSLLEKEQRELVTKCKERLQFHSNSCLYTKLRQRKRYACRKGSSILHCHITLLSENWWHVAPRACQTVMRILANCRQSLVFACWYTRAQLAANAYCAKISKIG